MKTEHSPICDKELPKDVHSKVVDEDDEDDDGDYSGFFDDDDEDKIPSKSEPNIGCRPQYEDDDDDEIILRRKPKPRKKTATVKKPPRFRPVSEEPISGSLVIASLKSDKFVPCLCKKTPNVGLEFFVVFESEGELKKYDTITDVVAWAYSL